MGPHQGPRAGDGVTYTQAMNHYRIALVRAAMLRAKGNKKAAARGLGIQPQFLRRLIDRYAIVEATR